MTCFFLFGVNIIFISSLRDPKETKWIFGRNNEIKLQKRLNGYLGGITRSNNHVKLIFWACSSKISCTYGFRQNPQNSFHWVYRQPGATNQRVELPSLSLMGLKLKQLSGLATNCANKNSQNFCAPLKGTEFFHSLDYLFIQASVFTSAWPVSQHHLISLPWSIKQRGTEGKHPPIPGQHSQKLLIQQEIRKEDRLLETLFHHDSSLSHRCSCTCTHILIFPTTSGNYSNCWLGK